MADGAVFREFRPWRALDAHVASVWVHAVPPDGEAALQRDAPDGSVTLSCGLDGNAWVRGPRSRAAVDWLAPGITMIGARLRPAAGASVLRFAPAALLDAETEADALGGDWGARLGERVAAGGTRAGLDALQAAILDRIVEAPDPLATEAVRRLLPGSGAPLGRLPDALAISERQLRRRVQNATGLAPKPLQRVLRFQGFLALLQRDLAARRLPGPSELARIAADTGYADQAHLTRESTRLTGLPPRALIRETARRCGPGHDHAVSFAPLVRALVRA